MISVALKPCRVSMQVIRRVSRSCTRPVSLKYFGSSTKAPATTPGPLPRSHCSSEAFFGPRFFFQSSSPFISNSSAGLPSCSISRYLAMPSSAALPWACTAPAASRPLSAKAAPQAVSFMRYLLRCIRRGADDRNPGSPRNRLSRAAGVAPLRGSRKARRGWVNRFKQSRLRRCGTHLCCRSTSPRSCRPWRRP
ncbi:hypothetical protein FQZ97_883080 [compost metagenome]